MTYFASNYSRNGTDQLDIPADELLVLLSHDMENEDEKPISHLDVPIFGGSNPIRGVSAG